MIASLASAGHFGRVWSNPTGGKEDRCSRTRRCREATGSDAIDLPVTPILVPGGFGTTQRGGPASRNRAPSRDREVGHLPAQFQVGLSSP